MSIRWSTPFQSPAALPTAATPMRLSPPVAVTSNRRVKLTSSDTFLQSSWTSWTRTYYDAAGRQTSQRVYFSIPTSGDGVKGIHYLETTVGYDSMNRQHKTVSADGTITRTVINPRDQVVSTWIGTDDTGATDTDPTGTSGNNMVQLTATQYDSGLEGGNGLVTQSTQMVNATTADNRVINYEHDWRNRGVKTLTTDGIDDFQSVVTLDNQGRTTKSQAFRDDSGTLVLLSQSESFFDQRGRTYQSKNYAVSDTGVLGNALESNQWFDATGQIIKSASPGSEAFTKTIYDAVGRQTDVYTAYYDGVGTDSPTSVLNDIVLTQSETTYNDAGQVLTSVSKDRLHDTSGTGELNGPSGSNPKSRDSYAAAWYDEVGRSIAKRYSQNWQ